jgi:hypothetical protein
MEKESNGNGGGFIKPLLRRASLSAMAIDCARGRPLFSNSLMFLEITT